MDRSIETVIQEKLDEIQRVENVRILHCVESGSRAWGFASPDSDYDVRFIYVRPRAYYLRLDPGRDVIEWQLDETLDMNGWDLQKALRLLHKSNPTLFEWNSSPIVYRTTPEWTRIGAVVGRYFQEKHGLYHYLSAAKSNYREYLRGETVYLKKYFYVLRPLLACRWIMEKRCPPPVPFEALAEQSLDPALRPDVERLLEMKRDTPELGMGPRIDTLNRYFDDAISELDAILREYPQDAPNDWDALNRIFLDHVQ